MTELAVQDLTPQQREALHDRLKPKTTSTASIPTLGFKNAKSKVKGVEKGHYYTSKKNEDGETVYEDLGESVEGTILYRFYSYSAYDDQEQRLSAWTNEFESFDPMMGDVIVYCPQEGSEPSVDFRGPFPEFKQQRLSERWGKMKFQNVLYVLIGEDVYRMFVSNASNTGVVDGERGGDFDAPLEDSLIAFGNKLNVDMTGQWYRKTCTFKSNWLEENEYYTLSFNVGENSDDSVEKYVAGLLAYHTPKHQPQESLDTAIEAEKVFDIETNPAVSGIKASDLPF